MSDEPPLVLHIPCSNYPIFSLAKCTPVTRKLLDFDGPENDGQLIMTFDPLSGTGGRWVYNQLDTSRDLTRYTFLLYRHSSVSDTAVDMDTEVDRLRSFFSSQKWPAEFIPSPQKHRRLPNKPDMSSSSLSCHQLYKDSNPFDNPESDIEILNSLPLATATVLPSTSKLALKASSKHLTWPFKHVKPMADGF